MRPSGLVVHRSASHGSTCWVARLTRTRRPWVSSAITSVARSRDDQPVERPWLRAHRGDEPSTASDRVDGRALAGVHGRPPEAPSPGQRCRRPRISDEQRSAIVGSLVSRPDKKLADRLAGLISGLNAGLCTNPAGAVNPCNARSIDCLPIAPPIEALDTARIVDHQTHTRQSLSGHLTLRVRGLAPPLPYISAEFAWRPPRT